MSFPAPIGDPLDRDGNDLELGAEGLELEADDLELGADRPVLSGWPGAWWN